MPRQLLGQGRLRLKGNCHTHSTASDGTIPPQDVARRYEEAGYDFIYLTEHCDKLTSGAFPDFDALSKGEMLVMPGVEYRNTTMRNGKAMMAMLLGLGTLGISHWKAGLDQQTTIDAINEDGGLALLACTYWDGRTLPDMIDLTGVAGIEIFNATCESACSKGIAVMHWDELLEAGHRVWGLAVDDAHFSAWPDFALGWIVILADEKTPAAVSQGIRSGRFYSSCGPEIHEWSLDGDEMTLQCSPVRTITMNSVGPYGQVFRAEEDGTLTEATFQIDRSLPYYRMSCCDREGRRAWTNPVWTKDLN